MGWASRVNPHTRPDQRRRLQAEAELRAALALFADRATYETWLTARGYDDAHRAHLERFLPASLQAQGTV